WGARWWDGGMWHFRRQGNQSGLAVWGIVVAMGGVEYAVWEEADLDVGMWKRVCAGCRGAVINLEVRMENGEGEKRRQGEGEIGRQEAVINLEVRMENGEREKGRQGEGEMRRQENEVQLGLFGE
ncbi:MAG: hypothetical protein KAX64_03785, partial [Chromatiaceae bacterium]|nr:hypothetical protein [Chromatiaceae bacterium]